MPSHLPSLTEALHTRERKNSLDKKHIWKAQESTWLGTGRSSSRVSPIGRQTELGIGGSHSPSTQKTEAGRSLSLKLAWFTELVPGQPKTATQRNLVLKHTNKQTEDTLMEVDFHMFYNWSGRQRLREVNR